MGTLKSETNFGPRWARRVTLEQTPAGSRCPTGEAVHDV